VPPCRLNPNFHGDPDDGKAVNPAFAERNVQWSAFKRRHRDLVEDRLARQRIQLRNQMEPRRAEPEQA